MEGKSILCVNIWKLKFVSSFTFGTMPAHTIVINSIIIKMLSLWDKSISLIDPEWENNQECGLNLKERSDVFLFMERGDLVPVNLWKQLHW